MSKADELMSRAAGKVKAVAAMLQGETGIFRRLRDEHAQVSVLLTRIHASADEDDGFDTRSELLPIVLTELLAHAKAEEQALYALLQEEATTVPFMPTSEAEHDEIQILLEALSSMDLEGDGWRPVFERLRELVTAHVDREENEIFPRAREFIDAERAREIDREYLRLKEEMRQEIDHAGTSVAAESRPTLH